MNRLACCAHLLFSMPKTVWFNLHYLGWSAVWRLPVVVSHRVVLKKMGGRIRVEGAWQRAMIRIGFGDVAVFDRRRSQTVWHNLGLVVFSGRAILNHGSRISVEANGVLTLGDGFHINAETMLICRKEITFGRDCLLSWHVLVMDSDLHRIVGPQGTAINPDVAIAVGDHVWIGCRALIVKGSRIGCHCVVAAQSVVSGTFDASHCLLAGVPARVVKEGIDWLRDRDSHIDNTAVAATERG